MGWLGDVAGALTGGVVSGLFGMANARDANENAISNMGTQHAYNVDDYKHRYQWTVDDMRAAGLNPILAATNGIGGNVNGTALAGTSMAPTPDMASAFNSANQISSNREIAKMQNEVAKGQLALERDNVQSAIEQRKNDMTIANGRFELDKMVQEAAVKRADALNDATIKNMQDRLQAEIEHWERSDLNGAALAAAAMQSANAAGLQAKVAEELGISKQEVMQAEHAYIGLQSENAEEALKWQKWLNAHPQTRGAVGFIGAMFDTIGLVKRSVGVAYSGIKSTGIGDDW